MKRLTVRIHLISYTFVDKNEIFVIMPLKKLFDFENIFRKSIKEHIILQKYCFGIVLSFVTTKIFIGKNSFLL